MPALSPLFNAGYSLGNSSSQNVHNRTIEIREEATSTIPVSAIVGGVAAGVVLAVALVFGWVYCGRLTKRRESKQSVHEKPVCLKRII
jgi:hypothetical protein